MPQSYSAAPKTEEPPPPPLMSPPGRFKDAVIPRHLRPVKCTETWHQVQGKLGIKDQSPVDDMLLPPAAEGSAASSRHWLPALPSSVRTGRACTSHTISTTSRGAKARTLVMAAVKKAYRIANAAARMTSEAGSALGEIPGEAELARPHGVEELGPPLRRPEHDVGPRFVVLYGLLILLRVRVREIGVIYALHTVDFHLVDIRNGPLSRLLYCHTNSTSMTLPASLSPTCR